MTIFAWLILARWLHVAAVSLLFGAALFSFYGVEKNPASQEALRDLRLLLLASAVVASISGILWFLLVMTSVWLWIVRLVLAAGLIFLVAGRRWQRHEPALLILSAILLVTLTPLGHDATQTNAAATVHLLADAIHLVASGIWIGALVILTLLLLTAPTSETRLLHDALNRFSGVGPAVVIALILSGLANSGLVGPQNALQSFGRPYTQVLLGKIVLFLLMLVLAAANRYWLTPKLETAMGTGIGAQASIHALKLSIAVETALAMLVLAAVGWLGALPAPGAE